MADTTGQDLKTNVTRGAIWLRGLFMLLFAVIFNIVEIMLGAIVVFQFLNVLVTAKPMPRLVGFGESLGRFIYQIVRYLTFDTDDRPYPFADWPGAAPAALPPPKRKPAARKPKAAKED
jgi:hypothetical protein